MTDNVKENMYTVSYLSGGHETLEDATKRAKEKAISREDVYGIYKLVGTTDTTEMLNQVKIVPVA